MKKIQLKRVYDAPAKSDGLRVLVDRLWPRGVAKEALPVDLWLKEAAPSTDLRKWFGHETAKWETFKKRYLEELKGNEALLEPVREALAAGRAVTLLFAARDVEHNQAVVLRDHLMKHA